MFRLLFFLCAVLGTLLILSGLFGCSVFRPGPTPQVETAVVVSGEFSQAKTDVVDTMAQSVTERVTTEATTPAGIFRAVIDVDSLTAFGSVHAETNGVSWVATRNPATGKITTYIMQPGGSQKQTVDRQTNQAARHVLSISESKAKKDSTTTTKTAAAQPDRQRTGVLGALYAWAQGLFVIIVAVLLIDIGRPVYLRLRRLFGKPQ